MARLVWIGVSEKPLTQPAKQVIHDRLGVGQLLVSGPAARLEAYVTELADEERERNSMLQPGTDGNRDRIHQAGDRGPGLIHGDEDFAGRSVRIETDRDVPFMTRD